jgi:hypothetical protein
MTSEKAIEQNVCTWLAFQGFIPLKVGMEGYPDRCVILGSNKHLWIEFKTPKGHLRPQQVNRIAKLHEIGETVLVITDLKEAQEHFAALRLPSPLSTYGDTTNRRA